MAGDGCQGGRKDKRSHYQVSDLHRSIFAQVSAIREDRESPLSQRPGWLSRWQFYCHMFDILYIFIAIRPFIPLFLLPADPQKEAFYSIT